MIFLILEVFFIVVEAIITLMTFCIFTGRKKFPINNTFKSFLFITLYTVFTYWISYFIPIGMHTVLIFLFIVFSLSLITKTNLIVSCSVWIAATLFMFVLEFIIMIAAMLVTKSDMTTILEHQNVIFICTVIVKTIESITLAVIYRMDLQRFFVHRIFDTKPQISPLFSLQVFLLGIIVISTNYIVSKPDKLIVYGILLMLIYLLFIALAVIDFKERTQINMLANKSILQQEHIKNIEAIMNIIRKEKHDFANHLNTIYGLCTLNKPDLSDRIKTYISKAPIKPYYTNKSVDTGIDYIDALLAVKSNLSIDNEISFNIDIRAKLDAAAVEDKDLVAILGNIIDNAFDAILSAGDTENKYISITTFIIENSYYISVKNNGPEIPERNLKKIFMNGFSTKCSNKPDHGYGLFIVEQTVKKSGGSISVISNDQETEFLLKLQLKRGAHDASVREAYKYDPPGEL